MGPACKKKADSTDIDSTKTDINGIEIIKIEPVIKNKIAFVSGSYKNTEISIMNIDGSEQINLTNNLSVEYYPCFSH